MFENLPSYEVQISKKTQVDAMFESNCLIAEYIYLYYWDKIECRGFGYNIYKELSIIDLTFFGGHVILDTSL